MADIEKVISGLDSCLKEYKRAEERDENEFPCDSCPYHDDHCAHDKLMRDALELLKEQRNMTL